MYFDKYTENSKCNCIFIFVNLAQGYRIYVTLFCVTILVTRQFKYNSFNLIELICKQLDIIIFHIYNNIVVLLYSIFVYFIVV